MSDTFNFKRFSVYFILDFKETIRNHAMTIALCGLIPAFVLIFVFLVNVGMQNDTWSLSCSDNDVFAAIVSVMFFLFFPISRYGKLTKKGEGSRFLMTPVSTAEKFTSMVLISVFVIPVIFFGLYLFTDYLMFICFPSRVDTALCLEICPEWRFKSDGTYIGIDIPTLTSILLPFMVSSAGLLGALLFKKGKYAKTFLVSSASFILFATTLISLAENFATWEISEIVYKWGYPTWIIVQVIVAACCLSCAYRKTTKFGF